PRWWWAYNDLKASGGGVEKADFGGNKCKWLHHEKIVSSGGGDFECALGALLAFDVGEIECSAWSLGADAGLRPCQHLGALEVVGKLDQRRWSDDLHLWTGPG